MKTIRRFGFVILFSVAISGVFALQPVEQRDVGSRSSGNSVVIVSEWSRYKERLIDTIIDDLDDGNTFIAVRSFDDFPSIDPREFDSVLIINAGVGSEVRSDVVRWLNQQTFDRNITVLTTQITDWTPQITVDSVTTASRNRNIPTVSADLVSRIRRSF
jgi:hypothetical protein